MQALSIIRDRPLLRCSTPISGAIYDNRPLRPIDKDHRHLLILPCGKKLARGSPTNTRRITWTKDIASRTPGMRVHPEARGQPILRATWAPVVATVLARAVAMAATSQPPPHSTTFFADPQSIRTPSSPSRSGAPSPLSLVSATSGPSTSRRSTAVGI